MIPWLAGCAAPGLLALEDPRDLAARGAVRLVPAVPLPSAVAGADTVEVWVTLPDGGLLETEALADGRPALRFPAGSSADRVEWRGEGPARRIVDVRGTTLGEDGARTHHVYQPVRRDPDAALVGVEWPAGDEAASAEALDRFVAAVRPRRPDPDAWERPYRGKHGCDGCHTRERPPNPTPGAYGLVNRGTDGQGWFTPSTLLADHVPGEAYGAPAHPDHPFLRRSDGAVPTWSLDLPAALAAGDPLAEAHCASIGWIADHLRPGDAAEGWLSEHPCL